MISRRGSAEVAAETAALRRIAALEAAVGAHHPQRTLERGYALVESGEGAPITTAAEARDEGEVRVRFADDAVRARIEDAADE